MGDVVLSAHALVSGRWKLLLGNQGGGFYQGPRYPNASSTHVNPVLACGDQGCLFDVDADPNEYQDVREHYPDVAKDMKARLDVMAQHFFDNNDVGADSCPTGIDMPCACWMAMNHYGGFFGPYQEIELRAELIAQ